MKKEFFGAVIPSIMAFILSGIYFIVDGFFIGNCIGDAGLAAINVAFPVTAFLQALGTGIGMGGAVRLSIASSQGDKAASRLYFSLTLLILAAASVLCTLVLLPLSGPLLHLLGAEGELIGLSDQYMKVMILGAATQIFGTGITPLIRNLGSPVWAMTSMITGFMSNILFDFLFIYLLDWGMFGAGVATVIAQSITAVLCAVRLLHHRDLFTRRFHGRARLYILGILLVGISPFGLTFSPNFILILMNRGAMKWGGAEAVAVYASISYLIYFVLLLLQGVGDGCQPLISWCSGQQDCRSLNQVCRLAYTTAISITAVCCTLLFFVRFTGPVFFGASPEVAQDVGRTLPLFFLGLLALSFLRVLISRFYATGANGRAYTLIYGEPLFLSILLAILPRLFGMWGLWMSAPLSQVLTAILGTVLATMDVDAFMAALADRALRTRSYIAFCHNCNHMSERVHRLTYRFF